MRDQVWTYVEPIGNIRRSVEKRNRNQIKKFQVYKRRVYISELNYVTNQFLQSNRRFDTLIYCGYYFDIQKQYAILVRLSYIVPT